MATIGTIKMYASDNSGTSYAEDDNKIAYVGRLVSIYRIYYNIPVTLNSGEK